MLKTSDIVPCVWDDPFLLDDQLSDEERMIRASAAAFAAETLAPRIEKAYLEETSDPDIFRRMGDAGLWDQRFRRRMAAPVPAMSPMA